jgi:hypothetical protein
MTSRQEIISKSYDQESPSFYLDANKTSGSVKNRPAMGFTTSRNFYEVSRGNNTLTASQWAHLTAVYNGSSYKLYLNGAQMLNRSASGNILNSTLPLLIGANFKGFIDDLRIYNRALSPAEIAADMKTPVGAVVGDMVKPSISITSPSADITLTSTTTNISGVSSDNVGVTKVSWASNAGVSGTAIGTTNWSINNLSLQKGLNVFTVQAQDLAGNLATDMINIISNPPVVDTVPPVVMVIAPTSTKGFIQFTADASDNVGVVGVKFMINGVATGTEARSIPYIYNWESTKVKDGTYKLSARARDAAGLTSVSSAIDLVVKNTDAPPVVGKLIVDPSGVADATHFRTIQACADVAKAGDVCLVAPGTYNEMVVTKAAGVSGKYVTFKAVPGTVTARSFTINHDYVKVDGFILTGTLNTNSASALNLSYVKIRGNYCDVANNVIKDGQLDAVGIGMPNANDQVITGCVVENNILDNIQNTNIELHGIGNLVVDNTIKNTPYDAMRVFGFNQIIRGNTFSHIDTKQLTHTDIIQTWGPGEKSDNIIFENNFIKDCYAQVGMFSQDGGSVQNFIFRNNIYVNVAEQANVYIPGTKWYNNLFINANYVNAPSSVIQFKNGSSGAGLPTGSIVRNNVFIASPVGYGINAAVPGGLTSDNNLSFATVVEAKFVNPAANDYHLAVGSPLIDAGYNVGSAVSLDKDGNIRPIGSAFDAGPYEYQGSGGVKASRNLFMTLRDMFVAAVGLLNFSR